MPVMKSIKAIAAGLFVFYVFATTMIAYSQWDIVAIVSFGLFFSMFGILWQTSKE